MPIEIGAQPVKVHGKEALAAIASGMSKAANRNVDPASVQLEITHASGEVTRLQPDDKVQLTGSVATAKPTAKPAKPAKAAKSGSADASQTAPKGPPPKSPFENKSQS